MFGFIAIGAILLFVVARGGTSKRAGTCKLDDHMTGELLAATKAYLTDPALNVSLAYDFADTLESMGYPLAAGCVRARADALGGKPATSASSGYGGGAGKGKPSAPNTSAPACWEAPMPAGWKTTIADLLRKGEAEPIQAFADFLDDEGYHDAADCLRARAADTVGAKPRMIRSRY